MSCGGYPRCSARPRKAKDSRNKRIEFCLSHALRVRILFDRTSLVYYSALEPVPLVFNHGWPLLRLSGITMEAACPVLACF